LTRAFPCGKASQLRWALPLLLDSKLRPPFPDLVQKRTTWEVVQKKKRVSPTHSLVWFITWPFGRTVSPAPLFALPAPTCPPCLSVALWVSQPMGPVLLVDTPCCPCHPRTTCQVVPIPCHATISPHRSVVLSVALPVQRPPCLPKTLPVAPPNRQFPSCHLPVGPHAVRALNTECVCTTIGRAHPIACMVCRAIGHGRPICPAFRILGTTTQPVQANWSHLPPVRGGSVIRTLVDPKKNWCRLTCSYWQTTSSTDASNTSPTWSGKGSSTRACNTNMK